MTPQPVSPVTGLPYEPVDIVTFNYNKDMAYAPAAKTYDVRSFFLSIFPSTLFCILTDGFHFTGGHRYGVGALARIALV